MSEKKTKESDFKLIVRDLINNGKIQKTIKDIAHDLETYGYSYRSIYAYINQDSAGSIETAARIARSVDLSLNDIYIPVDGSYWPTASEAPIADPKRIERALKILDLLERPYCDDLNRTTNELLREANKVSCEQNQEAAIPYFELAKKMQVLVERAEVLKAKALRTKATGGDENGESE